MHLNLFITLEFLTNNAQLKSLTWEKFFCNIMKSEKIILISQYRVDSEILPVINVDGLIFYLLFIYLNTLH